MPATVNISLDQLYTAVGTFVQLVLGSSVPTVIAQENRVPAPPVTTDGSTSPPPVGYVQMQAFHNRRLRTNIDTYDSDAQTQTTEVGTEMRVQLDFYGPNSHDWATAVAALWRDDYGCQNLAPTCAPLHADEATQVPLVDGEAQYEDRWTVQALLQYNPSVTVGQQSATALAIKLINVDERYPP